jgi:hypothetical protein
MVNRTHFVCPDIDCYVATLERRLLGHGIDYYKGLSSMSGYGFGSWFSMLFHSVLPLARKYISPVAADFASSTLHDWGSGKNIQESVSQNIRPRTWSVGKKFKQREKGLKMRRKTPSLVSLKSARKRKASKKVKKIQKGFLFLEKKCIYITLIFSPFSHLISKSFQCGKCRSQCIKHGYYEQFYLQQPLFEKSIFKFILMKTTLSIWIWHL